MNDEDDDDGICITNDDVNITFLVGVRYFEIMDG